MWQPTQSGVYGLVGLQGDGKSYTGTMWALSEYLNGRRNIVTNLALDAHGWIDTCAEGGISTLDLMKRVLVLDSEQVWYWWRHRGPSHTIEPSEKLVVADGHTHRSITLPTQHATDPGTMFILDEADVILGASQWKQVGPECELYVRQVRKHHDILVLITHVPKNIDRFVRDQAFEWHHVKNHGRVQFRRIKKPKVFWDRVYRDMDGKTVMLDEHWYQYHQEIGRCYKTEAGVGASGQSTLGGDKTDKIKGMHWSVVPVGMAALLMLVCGLFYGCNSYIKHRLDVSQNAFMGKSHAVGTNSTALRVASVVSTSPVHRVTSPGIVLTGRYVAWMVRVNGEFQFGLSDGTILRNPHARLMETELVLDSGERFPLRCEQTEQENPYITPNPGRR